MPQLLSPLRWYHLIPSTAVGIMLASAVFGMAYFLAPSIYVAIGVLIMVLLWEMTRGHVPIGMTSLLVLEAALASESAQLPPTVSSQMAKFASSRSVSIYFVGAAAVLCTLAFLICTGVASKKIAGLRIYELGIWQILWFPHLAWLVLSILDGIRDTALRKIQQHFQVLHRNPHS